MKPKILVGLLIASLLLASCALSMPTSTQMPTPSAVYVQRTDSIRVFQTPTVASPTPAPTSTPSKVPTQPFISPVARTYLPSATPLPTGTPIPSLTPVRTVLIQVGCNLAAFVDDVTIPDGTQVNAGATFLKTWRVKNVGSCTWTKDYRLAFVRGNPMGGPALTNLPGDTAPGETVDLSLNLTAPGADGTYTGVFQLMDADGKLFGSKVTADFGVQVSIRVGEPQAVFAVTHVGMSVDSPAVTTACPPGKTFTFHAEIVTNAPGTVKYHWIFSDGHTGPVVTLNYQTAGPNMESTTWTLGTTKSLPSNPYGGWAQVFIDEPNNQAFSQQPFVLGCIFAP